MTEILCSKSHEYVYEKDNFYHIGVTDYLLEKLGELHFVELPSIGEFYTKGEIFGYLEAEILATELFMPVSGKIEEVNIKLQQDLTNINPEKIADNWLIKVSSEFFSEDKEDLTAYNIYKEENK